MLKKQFIFSSILFFSLVTPFCIIFLWYQGQLLSASTQAHAYIQQDRDVMESVWLKFSIEEAGLVLKWEHDKEFFFRGEMFDVIESCTAGDSVSYHCYADKNETYLKKEFRDFVYSFFSHKQQNNKQKQYSKDFFKSICFHEDVEAIRSLYYKKENVSTSCYCGIANFVLSPLVPPPQAICDAIGINPTV